MGKKIHILPVLSFIPLVAVAQLHLTIEIMDLRNDGGQILLELRDGEEMEVAGATRDISDGRCVIVFNDLPSGKYAFRYFHDENKNGKTDTNWLGIPKEGFGFSNDPAMLFGPPSFDKTVFELNESGVIRCKPTYY
ncbi:MAG: DUF2141 domain-containing protein [Candidatus Marinimicrobia bacterium]|nr:DUF2141 domain-containing protein [Candidatus Neomarinimicrobiota bacterium]